MTIKDAARAYVSTNPKRSEGEDSLDFKNWQDDFWNSLESQTYPPGNDLLSSMGLEELNAMLTLVVDKADEILNRAEFDPDYYASEARWAYAMSCLEAAHEETLEARP